MSAVEIIGGIADLYVGYFSGIMNWAKVTLFQDNSPFLVFLAGIGFWILPPVLLSNLSRTRFCRKIEGKTSETSTLIIGLLIVPPYLLLFIIPGAVLMFFGALPLGQAFITPLWNAIR